MFIYADTVTCSHGPQLPPEPQSQLHPQPEPATVLCSHVCDPSMTNPNPTPNSNPNPNPNCNPNLNANQALCTVRTGR